MVGVVGVAGLPSLGAALSAELTFWFCGSIMESSDAV